MDVGHPVQVAASHRHGKRPLAADRQLCAANVSVSSIWRALRDNVSVKVAPFRSAVPRPTNTDHVAHNLDLRLDPAANELSTVLNLRGASCLGRSRSASPPLTTTKHPEMTFVNVEKSSLPEGETGVLESALAKQIEGLVPCMPTVRIATPLNAIPDELTHLTPAGRMAPTSTFHGGCNTYRFPRAGPCPGRPDNLPAP